MQLEELLRPLMPYFLRLWGGLEATLDAIVRRISGSAEWDLTLSITIATSAHGIASSASTYTIGFGRFFRLLPTESSKSAHVDFFDFNRTPGSTGAPPV